MTPRPLFACLLSLSVLALGALPAHAAGIRDVNVDRQAVSATVNAPGSSAVAFTAADGKTGWAVRLGHGSESLPTPAATRGMILSGGGYSSNRFTALRTDTGKVVWTTQTFDGGPTAPVYDDNGVYFNTESCSIEGYSLSSGKPLWHQMVGGTLLTQPVMAGPIVVVPHPTVERTEHSDRMWMMVSCDAKTGQETWDTDMTGDVLSAPVYAFKHVFFATTNGMSFCIRQSSGGMIWQERHNATSAPVVLADMIVETARHDSTFGDTEGMVRYDLQTGEPLDKTLLAPVKISGGVQLTDKVDLGSAATWDFQGSKIAYRHGRLINAVGNVVNCVDAHTGKVLWQTRLDGSGLSSSAGSVSPPALGETLAYMTTAGGHLIALRQSDGSVQYDYKINHAMKTQPLLVDGNVYATTTDGMVVCLKLGDKDASGWTAWGGDATHNKTE